MKPQEQLKVPKLEIDLSRIQQLSRERDDENWKFRSWLKGYAQIRTRQRFFSQRDPSIGMRT